MEIVIGPGESHPDLKGIKIKDMTPKQLHKFAQYYNWDGGCGPLLKVIRHPRCDEGTARLIYWHGEPDYACQFLKASQVPSYYREEYALLTEIERRVKKGAYKTNSIKFDPRNVDGDDLTSDLDTEDMKREIPDFMYPRKRR
jgi:hypothetical protein